MEKIVYNGVMYEAVDFRHVYDRFKSAIDLLQDAKNTVTDKNELRTIKACQQKIKKSFDKLKVLERERYAAKFRPLSDEERLANLDKTDARLEKENPIN